MTGDKLSQLQSLLASMGQQDLEALARAGISVPTGDLTQIRTGRYKYGVRCTACNRVALYFIGDRWVVDGVTHEEPPAVPHHAIAWTQMLEPHQIDRSEPRCQHCQKTVVLNPDGSFNRSRGRIVQVELFEAQREVQTPEFVKREARRLTKDSGAGSADFSHSYVMPDQPVSKAIDARFGEGTAAAIGAVADQHGITEALRTGKMQG